MTTSRLYRRLAIASATAAGALLTVLAAAAPAFADDPIDVRLDGLSSSLTAGARTFDGLSVTLTNKTNNNLVGVYGVFTVRLDGLPVDGVRILRVFAGELSASGGGGQVVLTDPTQVDMPRNNRRTTGYQLQFTATAPSGRATVSFDVYSGSTRLGGASGTTTVKGNAAAQASKSASPSPGNTDPGVIPTFTAGPTYSIAPLEQAKDPLSSGVPISLYAMGAVLVGVGGVVLWLVFRPQRPVADTGAYPVAEFDQARPSSLGYPRTASLHPTAVLPPVRDPVDPWAKTEPIPPASPPGPPPAPRP